MLGKNCFFLIGEPTPLATRPGGVLKRTRVTKDNLGIYELGTSKNSEKSNLWKYEGRIPKDEFISSAAYAAR